MPICPMMNIANHIRVGSYPGLKLVNMVDAPIAARTQDRPTQRRHRHAGPATMPSRGATPRLGDASTNGTRPKCERALTLRLRRTLCAESHAKTFHLPEHLRRTAANTFRQADGKTPRPFTSGPVRAAQIARTRLRKLEAATSGPRTVRIVWSNTSDEREWDQQIAEMIARGQALPQPPSDPPHPCVHGSRGVDDHGVVVRRRHRVRGGWHYAVT